MQLVLIIAGLALSAFIECHDGIISVPQLSLKEQKLHVGGTGGLDIDHHLGGDSIAWHALHLGGPNGLESNGELLGTSIGKEKLQVGGPNLVSGTGTLTNDAFAAGHLDLLGTNGVGLDGVLADPDNVGHGDIVVGGSNGLGLHGSSNDDAVGSGQGNLGDEGKPLIVVDLIKDGHLIRFWGH